jgi:tryptophan-rich sensory protein
MSTQWTQFDAVQLVAWAVFIFWEPYTMKRTEREKYDQERPNLAYVPANIPGWIFPIVWTILKSLNTAVIVVFSSNIIDTNHWSWITVFSLFFANQVLSKFWTLLFFRFNQRKWALAVAVLLFTTALAAWICMIVGRDNSNLYGIPIGLFVPYTLWLGFAIFLNVSWLMIPHNNNDNQQQEPLLPKQSQIASFLAVGGKFNHKSL